MAPIDLNVSQIPMWFFVVVHTAILLVTLFFASRAFRLQRKPFGWAMVLLAVGEVSYLLYHFEVTTFLLSHTVSEVLVLLAAILVYTGFKQG